MKPKYNFFANSVYALKGLKALTCSETSFKIELIIFAVLLACLWVLEPCLDLLHVKMWHKILLTCGYMFILICEAINSAIEAVVDLISPDFHPLAGRAKDIGSSVVFLSICNYAIILIYILKENLL